MIGSMLVLAEGGATWTPETYYIAVAVAQLVVVLVAFRVMNVPPDYNTFVNGVLIVGGTNATAYLTKEMGLIGVLLTGLTLFILLAMITRGDVLKSLMTWVLLLTVYWAVAYFVVPAEEDLYIEQLGAVPYAMMEGGLEAEPMTQDDYEQLRDGDGEDEAGD